MPGPCLARSSLWRRRELGERDHRGADAGTAAIAGVHLLGPAGHRAEAEVHAVARRDHGERPVVALERRVLGPIADAERDQQAERDERRPLRPEPVAQLLQARPDASLRGAEGQAELGRHLVVREVVEKRETDRLALRRR